MDSKSTIFHTEVMQGIYQITSSTLSPTGEANSLAPGNPTRNSYLVVGDEKSLLFDLALEEVELKEYAENLSKKPMKLVLSHGHYDHVFNLNRFSEVWIHPADEPLLHNGMFGSIPVNPCPTIHKLIDGNVLDLGNREIDVIHIPGHTEGSILLLDKKTRTLLSGDTGTRRLLYLCENVPLKRFCDLLKKLQFQNFDVMYSAHDRCALPKVHLEHMLDNIINKLPISPLKSEFPEIGELTLSRSGDVFTINYFDMAIPSKYIK